MNVKISEILPIILREKTKPVTKEWKQANHNFVFFYIIQIVKFWRYFLDLQSSNRPKHVVSSPSFNI
jgi:hypothetical protein